LIKNPKNDGRDFLEEENFSKEGSFRQKESAIDLKMSAGETKTGAFAKKREKGRERRKGRRPQNPRRGQPT